MINPVPQYTHDCDECVFLDHYNGHDLYFCKRDSCGPTVIARYGNLGESYRSGLNASLPDKELRVAKTLAIVRGLIKEKKKMKLEIESEKVLEAAKKCPEWKEGLETLFPEAFKSSIDFDRIKPQICTHSSCNLRHISYTLDNDYDWRFISASDGYFHLIPTKKENL